MYTPLEMDIFSDKLNCQKWEKVSNNTIVARSDSNSTNYAFRWHVYPQSEDKLYILGDRSYFLHIDS